MSKIKEKLLKIFEWRKKELKDEKKKDLENELLKMEEYIDKIIDIFEASNIDVEALVWRVRLYIDKKILKCQVSFAERKAIFFTEDRFELQKQVKETMKSFDNLEIPGEMMEYIEKYFKKKLKKYFKIYKSLDTPSITITLKR